jgi:hypothetical protein
MKKPQTPGYAKTSNGKKICGRISARPNISDASLGLLTFRVKQRMVIKNEMCGGRADFA